MYSKGFNNIIPRYIRDIQNYTGFTYKSPINLLYIFTVKIRLVFRILVIYNFGHSLPLIS